MGPVHDILNTESNDLINELYQSYPDYMRSYTPSIGVPYERFYRYLFQTISNYNTYPFNIKQSTDIIPPHHGLMSISKYIPDLFKTFIYNNINYQYVTIVTYVGINITIVLSSENKLNSETVERMMRRFVTSVYICFSTCNGMFDNDVTIYVYDIPINKDIYETTDVLGPININSGLSYVDGGEASIIYRSQESLKVFIHEILHLTGNGPNKMDDILTKKMKRIIPVNTDVSGEEIYVEMIARIINSAFVSYECCDNTFQRFQTLIDKCIHIERIFAVCQTRKMIDRMGITSFKLTRKSLSNFKEDTNVFAYYIATAALFVSGDFIPWVTKHNDGIKFNLDMKTLDSYIMLIKKSLSSKEFYHLLYEISPHKSFGARMSVIEML